jgi:alkanesulfonate monooxygenase SsuD/methylene tetrahydromethanopterin reductase-like flavin-dependent oxidoreductase (luciferase family)
MVRPVFQRAPKGWNPFYPQRSTVVAGKVADHWVAAYQSLPDDAILVAEDENMKAEKRAGRDGRWPKGIGPRHEVRVVRC